MTGATQGLPMPIGKWRSSAARFEAGEYLRRLAALANEPGFGNLRIVPSTLEELAHGAGPWGAMACEVSRWLSVAAWPPEQPVRDRVMQHLWTLQKAGCYPSSLHPGRYPSAAEQTANRNTALAAHRRWREAGSPMPPIALYTVQQHFRAEVRAAAWRISDSPMHRTFIESLDDYNRKTGRTSNGSTEHNPADPVGDYRLDGTQG